MKMPTGVMFAVLVVVLVIFEMWQYREQQAYRQAMQEQIAAMHQQMTALSSALQGAEEAEKAPSLGNILEEANRALIDGWSVMVDTVERELQRAQREIAESRKSTPGQSPAPGSSPEQSTDNDGAGAL